MNRTVDPIVRTYERAVIREGLFDVAFYGASGSRSQVKRLNALYRAARKHAKHEPVQRVVR